MSQKNHVDSKVSLPETSRSLPIVLMRAREAVMAPIRQMLNESGITEQQWRILRVLSESGSQDASRLAMRACITLPSLTRISRSMIDRGLIERETDGQDRRRYTVSITPNGQKIIDDKEYRDGMVDFNYEIGKAFFSYSVLRRKLRALITNFTGQENL